MIRQSFQKPSVIELLFIIILFKTGLKLKKPHQVTGCRKNSSNELKYINEQLNRQKLKTAKESRKKGKRLRHSDESSDEESSAARKPRKKRKKIHVQNQSIILSER